MSHEQLRQDWGVLLFKPGNPGFREPEFLDLLQQAADPYLHGSYANSPRSMKLTDQITQRFLQYWDKLASQPTAEVPFSTYIIGLEPSGTEANLAVIEMVKKRFQNYRRLDRRKKTEILIFSETYGSYGAESERLPAEPMTHLMTFADSDDLSPEDMQNLNHLRQIFSDPNRLIAGIFLEVVTNGYHPIRTFRPAFLKGLRALADEFDVAIIADEIFVGLGRTGKFWSFEHFPGFVPDYVTFGKGLMLSGYAWVDRIGATAQTHQHGNRWDTEYLRRRGFYVRRAPGNGPNATFAATGLSVLQASQVLKIISDGDLVNNAHELGPYILARNLSTGRFNGLSGLGLHFQNSNGRFTPPLDITKEDIDSVLFTKKPEMD